MRWVKAARNHVCTGCADEIEKGTDYYANSTSAFCQPCGVKRHNKEMVYSSESKSYTDVKNKEMCDFCKSISIGHLNGKSVCQEHIGDAVAL
mgnify:CR=1 FL=1|jgi:hypothetical protein